MPVNFCLYMQYPINMNGPIFGKIVLENFSLLGSSLTKFDLSATDFTASTLQVHLQNYNILFVMTSHQLSQTAPCH